MDLTTKGIIICLIVFYVTSNKMLITSQSFLKTNGDKFSIMDFELPKSKAYVEQLIKDFGDNTKVNVIKSLNDDYVFMIGAYPGIALMCYKAMDYTYKNWLFALTVIAALQIIAWIFDIVENIYIRQWIEGVEIRVSLGWFKAMVWSKFVIAITGALLSIFIFLTSGWCLWK
jgi:hypothetical protein